MYKNKKILAIIPARGGSKGIPNKNIRLIKGKPLIYYTINASKKCNFIDRTIVSTDSKMIASIAKKYGADVPFLRPHYLATDTAKTIECILYTLAKLKGNYNVVVVLQPTSPLRTSNDIKEAIKLFFLYNESVVSVCEENINPLLIRTINKNNVLKRLINKSSTIRRQVLPKFYKVNGAIYVNHIDSLSIRTSLNDNKIGYVMPTNRSIDIDTFKDIKLVNSKTLNKNG